MKKIAVVDDTPVNLKLIDMLLRQSYDIQLYNNGKEFLDALNPAALPDLVILDRMMPAPTGDEVCMQLKSQPLTTAIPVIMCSALSSEVDIDDGLSAGANEYLTKPLDRNDLLEAVDRLI